ncbi:sigma-70 family RNA polymerase sigma factor [Novosphingobium resinovorum]|uniref:sigma-70 family RNA polymerase sigma factor n=1 Tax=Novosphingobium resinovorum TaxID=158500 RepID=UPI002ED6A41B|nr:sigma-70 family RNA polymerase sigma factor [Novosphingobium resinovorum]
MNMANQRLADFEKERPRLLRLAYRMLGSVSEAEDIAQDAWLRWSQVAGGVDTPAAYLTRIVTRLCLDQMKSARARREEYVGAWIPEPLVDLSSADDIADEVTLTLMMALERLSPLERAAFLLHDVFNVALPEIAAALDRDTSAVRQLAVRARRHVRDKRPRFAIDPAKADTIARAFFAASRDGDSTVLASMLAEDVTIHADGGGRVTAFRNIISGVDRALRLFAGLARKQHARPVLIRTILIDGLPGFVSIDRGALLQTTALDIRNDRIKTIYIVRNPDKLGHVAAALGLAADQPLDSLP